MNTHRAVIETSVPPGIELVGAGDREWCAKMLAKWMETHQLNQYQRPLILVVDGAWLPTTEAELDRMLHTDPGVHALAKLLEDRGFGGSR